MHKKFIKYLCDPKTKEELSLESNNINGEIVMEGFLYSKSNRYPIVRGIPRFAGYKDDKNYTKSFGYQWNKWSLLQFDSHNIDKPYENFSLNMFEKITNIKDNNLNKTVIADIGCGPGRFLEIIRQKNALAIGIDLSDSVEAAGEIFASDSDVLICQADALNLPLKTESIDGIFSIGVLHHSNNAKRGFEEMVRACKRGGDISVSLYSPGGYYDDFMVNLWRKIFKFFWPYLKHYPALIYTYTVVYTRLIISKIPIVRTLLYPLFHFFPSIKLKDISWSILNTFDSVTPSNQYVYTIHQVFSWFKQSGLKNIEPSEWAGASLFAKK